jgi:hypothetical protein
MIMFNCIAVSVIMCIVDVHFVASSILGSTRCGELLRRQILR